MNERSQLEAFVGENVNYYASKWESIGSGIKSKVSFNWAAFFLSAFWMLYRKLYFHVGILALVITADVSLSLLLEDAGLVSRRTVAVWDRVSTFVYGFVIGSFSNYWYMRKFETARRKAADYSPNPSIQIEYLQRKGGTSTVGVLAAIFLIIALIAAMILYGPTE